MAFRTPTRGLAVAAFAAVGCGQLDPAVSRHTASKIVGGDGAVVVDAPDTRLNAWSALAVDASAGSMTLTVADAAELDHPDFGPLGAGDLLMVIQMQGAAIDGTDGPAFGAITDFGGAGLYELVVVAATSGDDVTIAAGCGGLANGYLASAGSQVVRVPQLTSLEVTADGSVVADPWDGARGGVVAVHVTGAVTVDGTMHASGAGFRGGAVDLTSNDSDVDNQTWRSTDPDDGAEKGESIAGGAAEYDAAGGRYGRAAAANGGGGGTAHNGGGGGGANAANGAAWTGQGVMDPAGGGAMAWTLDPAYTANGNSLSDSSGGGRGGYTFSNSDQDALTLGPGDAAWSGNQRRERGGWGGRPLDWPVSDRLFAGGGGGAGDSNNGGGGAGGAGGGIVLVLAGSVTGTGSIAADGANGVNTTPSHNDGPGGGGGGGTVVVETAALDGVTLSANGGNGGDQLITGTEAEGPGGGGGGGRIAVSDGVPVRTADGGANGTTASPSLSEFPANGATRGAEGVEDDQVELGEIAGCRPIDLAVTKTDGRDEVRRGGRTVYTIVVSLASDAAGATGIAVQDPLPDGVRSASWTCEATPGSSCADESGTGAIDTTVDLIGGGSATFTVDARMEQGAPDLVENVVTVAAPGYADGDPSNDVASDANDVLAEYGVAGSGCACRVGRPAPRPPAALALLACALAGAIVRRRRG